jgi:2-keto-4-pentenoate hydratase/2-oxohepta-3-ene-1,7-dioic acid hydratase in catechol pathway
MKFASFLTPDGRATYGLLYGDRLIDLGALYPQFATLKDYIASKEFASASVPKKRSEHEVSAVTFLPVIPNPGKIICVGLNYKDHIQETGRSDSEKPALFIRTTISQTSHRAPLMKPKGSDRLDYEGELALIIGKPGKHIAAGDALNHMAGYACYNDGSVRDWQRHTHQWTAGKNFDGTGSFGPWLATTDAIKDRSHTWLTTRVNGQTVQRASLAHMIFSIEDLIVYISAFTNLETGDVIVTGTPGGVGDRRSPPLYLFPGDTVEVEIDGVGVLENTVQEAV